LEQGIAAWQESISACPALENDEDECAKLVKAVSLYRRHFLGEEPLPQDFPLKKLLDRQKKKESADGQ
jgi:hypothetical protein